MFQRFVSWFTSFERPPERRIDLQKRREYESLDMNEDFDLPPNDGDNDLIDFISKNHTELRQLVETDGCVNFTVDKDAIVVLVDKPAFLEEFHYGGHLLKLRKYETNLSAGTHLIFVGDTHSGCGSHAATSEAVVPRMLCCCCPLYLKLPLWIRYCCFCCRCCYQQRDVAVHTGHGDGPYEVHIGDGVHVAQAIPGTDMKSGDLGLCSSIGYIIGFVLVNKYPGFDAAASLIYRQHITLSNNTFGVATRGDYLEMTSDLAGNKLPVCRAQVIRVVGWIIEMRVIRGCPRK